MMWSFVVFLVLGALIVFLHVKYMPTEDGPSRVGLGPRTLTEYDLKKILEENNKRLLERIKDQQSRGRL
jgi:hypothetical protein